MGGEAARANAAGGLGDDPDSRIASRPLAASHGGLLAMVVLFRWEALPRSSACSCLASGLVQLAEVLGDAHQVLVDVVECVAEGLELLDPVTIGCLELYLGGSIPRGIQLENSSA